MFVPPVVKERIGEPAARFWAIIPVVSTAPLTVAVPLMLAAPLMLAVPLTSSYAAGVVVATPAQPAVSI